MPRLLNKKYLFGGSFLGLVIGLSFFARPPATTRHEVGDRALASQKAQPLGLAPSKAHTLINVALRSLAGMAESDGEEVTLVGTVRAAQNLERPLQFEWELPAGVEVVQGELHGTWMNVEPGLPYETQIVVRGFSREDYKLIVLHGYVGEEAERIGHSAVVTSRPQDSYDMLAKAGPTSMAQGRVLSGKIVR